MEQGRDPKDVVLDRMIDYYNKNYFGFDICTISDTLNTQIWNIDYDLSHDMLFVFKAEINQIKGKKTVKFSELGDSTINPTRFNSQN